MSGQSSRPMGLWGGVPSRIALFALITLAVAGLAAAVVATLGERTARPAGSPLVEFEIRLPSGILLPDDRHIDVMLWNGHSGRGCKVIQVRRTDPRPVIAGQFLVGRTGSEQRLSLRFSEFSEGFWPMPIEANAPSEQAFGPWQAIGFVPGPRAEEAPLPPGRYDVRYRVTKYM